MQKKTSAYNAKVRGVAVKKNIELICTKCGSKIERDRIYKDPVCYTCKREANAARALISKRKRWGTN